MTTLVSTMSKNVASKAAVQEDLEQRLAGLLEDLSETQTELLSVLDEKLAFVVQHDRAGLEQANARVAALCDRLQACHDTRQTLLNEARDRGLPSENLGKLAAVFPEGKGPSLDKQVKQASSRMRLLHHQSLTNWVLAQRSLLHLAQLLEIIARGGRMQPTYGTGSAQCARGSLVDNEA